MFNKILLAVDESDNNQYLLNEAISLALANQASLVLTNVIFPFHEFYPEPGYLAAHGYHPSVHGETAVKQYMERWQALEAESLKMLKSLASQAEARGVKTELIKAVGSPGAVICDIASQQDIDLIIVGRHGRTGLKELFLGSVSNYVLHHAPCSVLTMQGEMLADKVETPVMETASA